VNVDHQLIVRRIEKEMNNNLKSPLEKLPTKKRLVMNASVVFKFFRAIDPYKQIMCPI
jgi:hypothetical protein